MNRNDGGTPPGELARTSAAAENVIDPGDYWTRSSDQSNKYQFTGDGPTEKKVVAAAKTTDAPGTYTVKEKDSLWTIASKLVNDSNHKDKSDKFKLDVVKGLVEKNKDTYKNLEANPDKISGGQVLKIDSVEELARLGHGKVLNTKYKPPAEREKSGEGSPNTSKDRPPRHHGGRRGEEQYAGQPYGDQQQHHRPMDLGPVKDIMGMIGMFAGGALMGNRFGHDRHHHHHRPHYDDYGRGYYDNGNYGRYGHPQHRYPNYNDYRQQNFRGYEPPVSYSHYGHPQQNFGMPMHQAQSQQFRIQQIQQQQLRQQQIQQWQQRHRLYG
jgi:hypothetical protein